MENLPQILIALTKETSFEEHNQASNAMEELKSDPDNFPGFFQFAISCEDKSLRNLAVLYVVDSIKSLPSDFVPSADLVGSFTSYFNALCSDIDTKVDDFIIIEPILHLKPLQNGNLLDNVITNWNILRRNNCLKFCFLQKRDIHIKNAFILIVCLFNKENRYSIPAFNDLNMKFYLTALCFEFINTLLLDYELTEVPLPPNLQVLVDKVFKASLIHLKNNLLNHNVFVRLWESGCLKHLIMNNVETLEEILTPEFISSTLPMDCLGILESFAKLPHFQNSVYCDINFALKICAYSAIVMTFDYQNEDHNIERIIHYEELVDPLFDVFPENAFEAFMSLFEEDINDLILVAYFIHISIEYYDIAEENLEVILEKLKGILCDTERETYEINSCIRIILSFDDILDDVLKDIYPITIAFLQQIPDREDEDFLIAAFELFETTVQRIPFIIDISEIIQILQQLCANPKLSDYISNLIEVICSLLYLLKESDLEMIKELLEWAIQQEEVEDKKFQFQIVNRIYVSSPDVYKDIFEKFLGYHIEYFNTTNETETAQSVIEALIIIKIHIKALKSKSNPNIIELYESALVFVDRNIDDEYFKLHYFDTLLSEIYSVTMTIRKYLGIGYSDTLKSILIRTDNQLSLQMCSAFRDDENLCQKMNESIESKLEAAQSIDECDYFSILVLLSKLRVLVNPDTVPQFDPIFQKYEIIESDGLIKNFLKLINCIIINGHEHMDLDTIVDFVIDKFGNETCEMGMFRNFIITCVKYQFISNEEIQKLSELYAIDQSDPNIKDAEFLMMLLITIIDTREDLREASIQTTLDNLAFISQLEEKSELLEQIIFESVLILHHYYPEKIDEENFLVALGNIKDMNSFIFLDTLLQNVFPGIFALEVDPAYKIEIIKKCCIYCTLYETKIPSSINTFTEEKLDICFQLLMQFRGDENAMSLIKENYPLLGLEIENTPTN